MKSRFIGSAMTLPLLCLLLASPSCVSMRSLGQSYTDEDASTGPNVSFDAPDASADASSNALTAYCPSNQCPAGWTTCTTSRFACDVNLETDPLNCGACGHECTQTGFYATTSVCIAGKCAIVCGAAFDCDGLPDNGCETRATTNENCGGCGLTCPDPAKPCVGQPGSDSMACGCPPPYIYCTSPYPRCVNPTNDDMNCGACDNACDPGGNGQPEVDGAYYGCVGSQCDKIRCQMFFGNCDSTMSNGCESFLLTPENCGACGTKCGDGQECLLNEYAEPECMCPPGQTLCNKQCDGPICTGTCRDLTSDPDNCGACNFACQPELQHSVGACSYGTCQRKCTAGYADCNGNDVDECETDTTVDPRNCGACGHACDAIAGQACVKGECVVEPCTIDTDAGVQAK